MTGCNSFAGGVQAANELQRLILSINMEHLLKLRAHVDGDGPKPTPLRLLVQGTAGTGKTKG